MRSWLEHRFYSHQANAKGGVLSAATSLLLAALLLLLSSMKGYASRRERS